MKIVKDYLKAYSNNYRSLHMPGHKSGKLNPLAEEDLFAMDITETIGSDDLYHPEGFLLESLERSKNFYNTIKTYYLVNGSTGGLLTAISACTTKGDQILIQRNAHHAVYNGIIVNALEPLYLYPKIHPDYGLYGGISPKEVDLSLTQNPKIALVVITSPTYEGLVLDIEAIAKVVHSHGKILLVDEAHGAHFPFFEFTPKTALELGADLVVQSLHKTLPALTQTALLHIKSSRIDLTKMDFYYQLYQTSSPSFVLVASIDSCLETMKNLTKVQKLTYQNHLIKLDQQMATLSNYKLLELKDVHELNVKDKDQTRLTIVGRKGSINGLEIGEFLMASKRIILELIAMTYVVGISTIADDSEALLEDFFQSIVQLDQEYNYKSFDKFDIIEAYPSVMTPAQAMARAKVQVPLTKALGQVSGGFIKVYPPSVPIVVPGETITQEIIEQIILYKKAGLMVHGVKSEKVVILK